MFRRLFLDHPRSVGESYVEHFLTASSFAGWLFVGALACAVHAFLPAAFRTTGSRTVGRLYRKMLINRSRHASRADPPTDMPSVDVWEMWEI